MLESSIFFNECAMFFPVTFNSVCVHFENKNKQAICIKAYILFKMYIFYFIYINPVHFVVLHARNTKGKKTSNKADSVFKIYKKVTV